jgi:hypothetical protein
MQRFRSLGIRIVRRIRLVSAARAALTPSRAGGVTATNWLSTKIAPTRTKQMRFRQPASSERSALRMGETP